jgi:hypothetical protein
MRPDRTTRTDRTHCHVVVVSPAGVVVSPAGVVVSKAAPVFTRKVLFHVGGVSVFQAVGH